MLYFQSFGSSDRLDRYFNIEGDEGVMLRLSIVWFFNLQPANAYEICACFKCFQYNLPWCGKYCKEILRFLTHYPCCCPPPQSFYRSLCCQKHEGTYCCRCFCYRQNFQDIHNPYHSGQKDWKSSKKNEFHFVYFVCVTSFSISNQIIFIFTICQKSS